LRRLSIVVLALNEEDNIALMINEMLPVARRTLDDFEIIMINDGSTDRTGEIMEVLVKDNPEVRVVHHPEPEGIGSGFWDGITHARFEYVVTYPGDQAYHIDGINHLFETVGSANLIISYRTHQLQTRSLLRVILSQFFWLIMVIITGCRPRDFHSAVVYPVQIVREMGRPARGYLFAADLLAKLISRKMPYVEIPASINPEETGDSQSLQWSTFIEVLRTFRYLIIARLKGDLGR
jgi:dolichol-phosphate mannosyltransferase